MAYEDDSLIGLYVSILIDGGGDQLGESCSCVCCWIDGQKIGTSATWKIDCQTRGYFDQPSEERRELRGTAAEAMHEDKQW